MAHLASGPWRWLCVVCVALVLPLLGAGESRPGDRFGTVVIDPGHGGQDEGAKGPGGALEKDIVLDVGRRLAKVLEDEGLSVVMTRRSDEFVSLEKRTYIANDARGDLFVSIHANAANDTSIRGTETFFISLEATDEAARRVAERENQALGAGFPVSRAADDPLVAILGDLIATEHLKESQEFARLAQEQLAEVDPQASRGVKQALFVVLSGVQMPASLVEIGFITNGRDEGKLRSRRGRGSIASALAAAVFEFQRRYDARHGVAPLPARGAN